MKEAPKEVGEAMARKYSKAKKPPTPKRKTDPNVVLGKRVRKPRVRLGEEPSESDGSDEEP